MNMMAATHEAAILAGGFTLALFLIGVVLFAWARR